MSTEIDTTILEQIGGRRFIAMTGARHLIAHPDGLSMRLPYPKINHVRITLTASDLYDMIFSRIRARKITEVAHHEGLYFDQLAEVFESETGLRTEL